MTMCIDIRCRPPHGHAHAFGLGEMTPDSSRLMGFGTSNIICEPFNWVPPAPAPFAGLKFGQE